jgi:hypothetical protein
MTTPRSASALLLCLGIATIAAMIGIAFLRTTSRLAMSGPNEVMIALARDAALSGVAHATEQILADYNAPDLLVADNGGAQTVANAPTFLDGPYRAPFVSLLSPNTLLYTQDCKPIGADDAPEENSLLLPFVRKRGEGNNAHDGWHSQLGAMIYDGRGRYIEVGYHNSDRPAPTAASPEPVATIRFTDLNATVPALGHGLFLDTALRRVTGGTAVQQRKAARYRLRYALGIEDLQAHLLSNPHADMDWDWRNPDNGYRKPQPWLDAAAYAWQNMVACSIGPPNAAALRMGHVFRGRGSATNADRLWTTGNSRFGYPATFPMMFRSDVVPGVTIVPPSVTAVTETPGQYGRMFWGNFAFNGDFHYDTGAKNLGGRLFRHVPNPADPRWAAIAADPDGGAVLTPIRLRSSSGWRMPTYAHAYMGPQLSWFNQYFAVQGSLPWGNNDGPDSTPSIDKDWIAARSRYMTVPTPFGRSLEIATGATRTWYQGEVQSPWLVNALTAAPQTISQMLLGYLYPVVKQYHYNREYYYDKTAENVINNPDGTQTIYDVFTLSTVTSPNPKVISKLTSGPGPLDLLNDQLGSGFADFPAPSSMFGARTIKPDYYQDVPEPRPLEQRYPGPLCRGDSALANQGSDDLGKESDTDALGSGRCTHTGLPFIIYGTSDQTRYDLSGTVNPWKKRMIVTKVDPLVANMRHSYLWDLAYGFTQALAYMRATWVQYPNVRFDPRSGFVVAALRDPTGLASSVEGLDRLLLRQLGENFLAPGTACPDLPILQTTSANINGSSTNLTGMRFQISTTPVSHTIRSLIASDLIRTPTVTSAARGKVMERMLNDFRLSFLGASPQYNADFRPLDFDGDGNVHCSCYPINAAATPEEVTYKTARWKTAETQAHPTLGALPGRGPALAALPVPSPAISTIDPNFGTNPWFCATGTFFVGKSRYYRILCRGEVYDNFLNKPVAAQTLETVLAVDPEGPSDAERATLPAANRPAKNNQVLFQRWHYNDSVSELPRQLR